MTRQWSACISAALILVAFAFNNASAADPPRMLMLTQSAGFAHRPVKREAEPLSGAEIAMTLLGRQTGEFVVDCSQDASSAERSTDIPGDRILKSTLPSMTRNILR